MSERDVKPFVDTAAELGLRYQTTVTDLVEKLGLPVERMTNGNAKGLSRKSRQILKRVLTPQRKTAIGA